MGRKALEAARAAREAEERATRARVAALCGTWYGVGRQGEEESTWSDVELTFTLTQGTVGTIQGNGLSQWHLMRKRFVVSGFFNLDKNELSLEKEQAKQKLAYHCELTDSDDGKELVMTGSCAGGT